MTESRIDLPENHAIEMLITSRERDIGGFSVRRLLPYMSHRMVGPFVFFDHMGPAEFEPGVGMDVRPHPHTHLSTVTYLFEGAIRHHDSLGSDQLIEPGAINYMTAGYGIVHSERTPEPLRSRGGKMNGIQCWIAVPTDVEDGEPAFSHHPAHTIPEVTLGKTKARVLLGSVLGVASPVPVQSDLFYAEVKIPKGATFTVDEPAREAAVYIVEGSVTARGEEDNEVSLVGTTMAVIRNGRKLHLRALEDTHLMLLGGVSLGPRFLFWNFVASSQEKLDRAKRDYAGGPGSARFPKVPGDTQEFIPLPEEPKRGTPL